jgi:hypothetical protein
LLDQPEDRACVLNSIQTVYGIFEEFSVLGNGFQIHDINTPKNRCRFSMAELIARCETQKQRMRSALRRPAWGVFLSIGGAYRAIRARAF